MVKIGLNLEDLDIPIKMGRNTPGSVKSSTEYQSTVFKRGGTKIDTNVDDSEESFCERDDGSVKI